MHEENNEIERIRKKLTAYKKQDIIFDDHGFLRMMQRGLCEEEIKETIINVQTLFHTEDLGSNKYDCYFKKLQGAHRYILFLRKKKCIVRSVMQISEKLQKKVERKWPM